MPTSEPHLLSRLFYAAERWQIPLYLLGIAAGAGIGLAVDHVEVLEVALTPVLGLLLYATFLGIPMARLGQGFGDRRFLGALLVLNFVVVPVLVFGLSRFVAHDAGVLIGLLLVLLTPCIDYVIVFSGLAGASHGKLLAAAPLLMVAQLLLLPGYLYLMAGPDTLGIIDPAPFFGALLWLILLPLALAAATQFLADRSIRASKVMDIGTGSMVPLMVLVLLIMVASQTPRILAASAALWWVGPLYAGFLAIMVFLGLWVARLFGVDIPTARALVFSGATRNSLVVLPLALALPASLAIAPAVVVTQTLVELLGMVLLVRLVPRLLPGNPNR
ncbi:arsenic resistance protein [Glutamicibacter uratoxydans]|uniref:arsenic resistance protein n=1 Tax=Glutamicibacter uratoxydans TaxID=43667 RepID=UPI003D6F0097